VALLGTKAFKNFIGGEWVDAASGETFESISPADGGSIRSGSRLLIDLGYRTPSGDALRLPRFVVTVLDERDVGIFRFDSGLEPGIPDVLPAEGTVACLTDPIDLTPGRCRVHLSLLNAGNLADYVGDAAAFEVEPDAFHASGRFPRRAMALAVRRHRWSHVENDVS